MNSDVLVAFLETVILLDVMQVISADDDRALHLGGNAHALQDLTTDADISGERALLVDELSIFSLLRGSESKPNVSEIPNCTLCLLRKKVLEH